MVPVLAVAQQDGGMTSLVTDSTKVDAIPTLADADSAYIQGDYLKAISMYEWFIENQGSNAT